MHKRISHSHKSDPKGTRFIGLKDEKTPIWAVDIQDVDPNLNAHGIPIHPTDRFVHWQDHTPLQTIQTLRGAYDRMLSGGMTAKEIEAMLDLVYDSGRSDQADMDNPDL